MNRWDATADEPEMVESVLKIFLYLVEKIFFWNCLGETTTSGSRFRIFM
jgi:hypothetical protein